MIGNFFAAKRFQSTSPVRGTTQTLLTISDAATISIHLPREGDDRGKKWADRMLLISIHVPREGDDRLSLKTAISPLSFQSTSPVRGTTNPLFARIGEQPV